MSRNITGAEINELLDKMQSIVTAEADRRAADGMSHVDVTAMVMTIAANISARCVALCAVDDVDPKAFCRGAAPILAVQIAHTASALALGMLRQEEESAGATLQ